MECIAVWVAGGEPVPRPCPAGLPPRRREVGHQRAALQVSRACMYKPKLFGRMYLRGAGH